MCLYIIWVCLSCDTDIGDREVLRCRYWYKSEEKTNELNACGALDIRRALIDSTKKRNHSCDPQRVIRAPTGMAAMPATSDHSLSASTRFNGSSVGPAGPGGTPDIQLGVGPVGLRFEYTPSQSTHQGGTRPQNNRGPPPLARENTTGTQQILDPNTTRLGYTPGFGSCVPQ